MTQAKISEAPIISSLISIASNLAPQDADDYRKIV